MFYDNFCFSSIISNGSCPPPNPSPTLLITVVEEVSPNTFHTVRQEFIKCTIRSAFLGSLSGTQGCAIAAEESP